MSIPAGGIPPSHPNQPQQPQTPANLPTSYVDPTGTWAAFLSKSGTPATAKDVQMFMNGLLKFFSIIIKQQQDAYKRSMQHLKDVEEGRE
jgi:hypothetical protein